MFDLSKKQWGRFGEWGKVLGEGHELPPPEQLGGGEAPAAKSLWGILFIAEET